MQVPGTPVPVLVPTVSMTKPPSAHKGEEANEGVSVAQQEAVGVRHPTSAEDVQVRQARGRLTWFKLKF